MISVMGIIFYLSHQPGDFVLLPSFKGLDKVMHVLAYGVLSVTFLYGQRPFVKHSNRMVISLMAVLFCIAYGISDEYHQTFIPGRFASLWDVVADGVGALLTAGIWLRKEGARD